MKTQTYQMTIHDMMVDILHKPIKHLRLTIYPPEGRIKITAPLRTSRQAIQQFVTSKLPWIKKHQAKIAQHQPPTYKYLSGEYHPYQGQFYLLDVTPSTDTPQVVKHLDGKIELRISPSASSEHRERLLMNWHHQQIKQLTEWLIPKWEAIIGVKVSDCRIKRMKTRWGTCNTHTRRIWLNLELAKKPLHCLEYVIVHEMVHLLEHSHNARFKAFMDKFMPEWRQHQAELNQSAQPCLV